ncbi:MAG: Mrp/NBP35 family ATP-binding protein, partial [bacterium]
MMGIFKNSKEEQQAQSAPKPSGLDGVAQVIAVASGKGGVGKSTVSTNLAVALAAEGSKVGLLDADIYGPSQPGMLGAKRSQLDIVNERLEPITKHKVKFVSMGSLISDDGPVVWRAPMATKMIMQFLNLVNWGELDYLVIDLPPGTGDVQLTLAQQAALTGAIIVTTPQNVALGVAKKGLRMFQQVNVPILGIVENMSGFTCSHCGQVTEIFMEGGGKQLAEETGLPYLGAIPLDPAIVQSGEDGQPLTLGKADSPGARAFRDLAKNLKEQLKEAAADAVLEPQQVGMA